MSDERKPLWPWIVPLVIGLLAYPLSFGPACWIASRYGQHQIPVQYLPIIRAWRDSPPVLYSVFPRYARLGMKHGSWVDIPVGTSARGSMATQRLWKR